MKRVFHSITRGLLSVSPVNRALRRLSRAKFLPSRLWKRMPVERAFQVRLFKGEEFRYISNTYDTIGRALFWRGLEDWEQETLSVFEALARQARTFLDVGANTGTYSLVACAANPNVQAMAFEPVPEVFQYLRNNVAANGWEDRCQVFEMAVSDREGTTEFHLPFSKTPTSASLNPDGFRGIEGRLIKVRQSTLDRLCEPTMPIDLIKIDVEGFEDVVLKGMPRILSEHQPDLIIECNPDGPIEAIESILLAEGYEFLHLHPEGPRPTSRITSEQTSFHARNFLCTTDIDRVRQTIRN